MKKAKLMLIFTIVCFAFMPKVFATNYMSVSKTDVKVGEEFTITVAVHEDIQNWHIVVTPTDNALNCALEDNEADILGDGTAPGSTTSTNCTINTAGTATFTLSGTFTTIGTTENPDGETIELNESIAVTVTAEEQDKGLASLTVSGGTLSPTFDSDRNTGYIIKLDSSETTSFSINAVAKVNTDTITVKRENGESYETIDPSNITFVTAGNNSTMLIEISVGEGERLVKYEIQVVKPTKVNPPELTKLTIDGEDISLITGTYTYEVTLDEKDSYYVTAVIKDPANYMFSDFLNPPVEISGKEFELGIVPKDPSSGLSSTIYHIKIKTNSIEPVTTSKVVTTQKPSSNDIDNPQTGSKSVYVVGIMLISSLIISIYLYKKNINGYN